VIPFNQFVHEAQVNGERPQFHRYVVKRLDSTKGVTRHYWWQLWDEFVADSAFCDQYETRLDAARRADLTTVAPHSEWGPQ
jgi:hypothetical protein